MTSYPHLLAAHSRALDGLRRYLAEEHDVVDERDLTWLSGPLAAAPSTRVARNPTDAIRSAARGP